MELPKVAGARFAGPAESLRARSPLELREWTGTRGGVGREEGDPEWRMPGTSTA